MTDHYPPITRAQVQRLLKYVAADKHGKGALTRGEILDMLRPVERREADGVDEQGRRYSAGDEIPRPTADIEEALRALEADGDVVPHPHGLALKHR